ncbi:PREDICTED: protein regulator of cytokinesis 1-like [Dufourea novaeangliae]|uniref:Protein regulator of cytokinesis 1 n=1 Tax=Dufourea novaeangliae TaxID=178035 RepID=A0A154PBL9_DUFNO|nr:PREDICTED: protein regulator of cytokinesis 1-like [Dufourea novaeangliae]KZC09252.1 Protein regulator of cytokinesis 1 [Dufourea novaeangliae]
MANLSEWEPLIEKTTVNLRNALSTLQSIWTDIGFTEEARALYCEQAFNHIHDLLNDMINESQDKKTALLNNVKQLVEQVSVMSKELGMDARTTGYEDLPLKEVEEVLRTDFRKLQYCKEQRLSLLKELHAKEHSLCIMLGTQPIGIEEKLPTEEELNSFKLYLETQEGEKNRLESNFKEMRRGIVKMMDELGISPSTNFEHLVYKDSENFVFSSNNMSKLRELKDHLKHQVERAKEYVESIKQELIALWKYLDEPERVCQSFLSSYVGYSTATIGTLQTELERCKEKRKQNISRYVSQVRSELVKLWDQCKFSEQQRKQFNYFNCQTYTEDLLTLHELEVKRLQDFYKANKSIFELLEERNDLWSKMKELLQRANDPDRFYNRGGQLLMEEKERKTIQKKLPKIEEQLRTLIQQFESVNEEPFTVNGMSVDELLKESWEHLNEEKETIKKARKEAKDKSVKKITLSASKKIVSNSGKKTPSVLSTKRHTPHSISKRKLLFTPSPNTSAKRRNLSIKNSGSKNRRSGRVSKKIIQSANKSSKSSTKKENSESQSSTVTNTTYNQFKEHLEDRRELRSSLLPEQVLMNATRANVKTPVRTPAKPLRKNMPIITITTTPKLSKSQTHKSPRSPRLVQATRLAAVSTNLPIIF